MTSIAGIDYSKPQVYAMHSTPLIIGELAGRTAYQSFDKSEHESIRELSGTKRDIESSKLLDSLSWVHFHESVIEHISINYEVTGTSRSTLQELARHRVASYTVQSTRYTMGPILNAFVASLSAPVNQAKYEFRELIRSLDIYVVHGIYQDIEIDSMHEKLKYQLLKLGKDEFINLAISKDARTNGSLDYANVEIIFDALQASKQKRNVGDNFKAIVTDNWKVNLVMTFNLRSLKNFLNLRLSGAAYFQIRWLAEEVLKATDKKYLALIVKEFRNED